MTARLSEQEGLAGRVSRAANKKTVWCRNLDGTIDVYCPRFEVVFVVSKECAVSWRRACDRDKHPIYLQGAADFALGIVERFS